MTDIFLRKMKIGTTNILAAANATDQEFIDGLPTTPVRCKVTRVRNVDHHRKYFALLNVAFDMWEPVLDKSELPKWAQDLEAEKNFDRFRKDIAILAGFYEMTTRVNGEIRVEAKSISFANMDQDEFENLYSKTIDVILQHIYRADLNRGSRGALMTEEQREAELRRRVDEIMAFDS